MHARIINLFHRGNIHEVFNAAVGYMCTEIFESVEYFCAPSVEKAIRELFIHYGLEAQLNKIQFVRISEWKKDTVWQRIVRNGITRALLDGYYMLTMPKNSIAIYPASVNAYFLWANSFINRLFRKRGWIFFHAELEHFFMQNKQWASPSQRFLFNSFFKHGSTDKRTHYCALGKSIWNNLQPFLNRNNQQQFQFINDPIFIPNQVTENTAEKNINPSLRIGTIGNMNKRRGLPSLLSIAETLKDDITLSVIGSVSEPVDYDKYPYIDFAVRRISNAQHFRAPLTREEFDKEIRSLDYILFLIPPSAYKLIASGTIYDALIMEKPIISLHNDFFDETLSLPCGYLFDTEAKICDKIRELIAAYPADPERELFVKNMRIVRERFKVENVSLQWKEKIEHLYGKS